MKVLATLAASTALLLSACGSSTPSGTDGLAQTYCAKIEPCCAMANLPTDGTTCNALFAVLTGGMSEDSAAIDACTAALQAEDQDAFCQDLGNALPACTNALAPGGGTVQPGGTCSTSEDCAAGGSGTPTCVFSTSSSGDASSVCVLEQKGVAGSAPCNGTVSPIADGFETVYVGSGTPAPTSYLCSTADALYCDATSGSCLAAKATGAACEDDSECSSADSCDFSSSTCLARTAAGGACEETSSCVSAASCTGGMCVALAASGAACSDSEGCTSGSCLDSVCVSAEAQVLPLYCGGGGGGGAK